MGEEMVNVRPVQQLVSLWQFRHLLTDFWIPPTEPQCLNLGSRVSIPNKPLGDEMQSCPSRVIMPTSKMS